jgi:type II secretory pathway pseudopilin PulG
MSTARCERSFRRPSTTGFTIIEAVMVMIVVGVVIGALLPAANRNLSRARVNRAANVVAGDLMQAQGLASRQRSPVILTVDSAARTVQIALPPPGNSVLLIQRFGVEGEFKLATLSATPGSVQVLPNGTTNSSITVTVGALGYTRQVRMTRAGQVRVL